MGQNAESVARPANAQRHSKELGSIFTETRDRAAFFRPIIRCIVVFPYLRAPHDSSLLFSLLPCMSIGGEQDSCKPKCGRPVDSGSAESETARKCGAFLLLRNKPRVFFYLRHLICVVALPRVRPPAPVCPREIALGRGQIFPAKGHRRCTRYGSRGSSTVTFGMRKHRDGKKMSSVVVSEKVLVFPHQTMALDQAINGKTRHP